MNAWLFRKKRIVCATHVITVRFIKLRTSRTMNSLFSSSVICLECQLVLNICNITSLLVWCQPLIFKYVNNICLYHCYIRALFRISMWTYHVTPMSQDSFCFISHSMHDTYEFTLNRSLLAIQQHHVCDLNYMAAGNSVCVCYVNAMYVNLLIIQYSNSLEKRKT